MTSLGAWRTYVIYHTKPVSSSVNKIAAQATSVSPPSTLGLFAAVGFNGASADAVSSSVRDLVGGGGTAIWAAHAPNAARAL